MKTRIFTALLLVCCSLAAFSQTTSVVADRIRAAEYFRVGGNTTQKITGFSTTIPAVPTDFTLPTTKALKDYVVASFMPIGSTASGDLQGVYPSPTVRALQGVAVSATTPINGQVLKLVAGVWTPTTDAVGPTYTAGSGISIGGNVITNTAPNVTQVLSLDGSELSLSNGGGTVELPGGGGGSLGTGFTAGGGSGTIPDGATATLGGGFIIANSAGYLLIDGSGVGEGVRAAFGPNGIQYTQDSENYLFDFNPADGYIEFRSPGGSLVLNPASSTLSGVGVQPISYTNASAPNNTIFYSTDEGKLCYKDPGGTVNPLY